MKRQNLCTTAIVIVMIVSFISAGCVGRFAAFNKLSDWNRKATKDKFANEAIFLALIIIPVYEIALLADAVVFNSIEFWTGKNPVLVEGDYQKVVESGDLKVVQTFHQDPGLKTMTAEYYLHGRLANTVMLSQQIGSSEFNGIAVSPDGTVKNFRIEAGESSLLLTQFNLTGTPTVEVVNGSALTSLSERVAGLIQSQTLRLASAH